ncbi:E3 ubiquitin-protein ligase UPL1 [Prunus yedoensis var. nudiflora]|uniref:E3 ubiquitin-protein ligase UPL1 n=1 Tax=Prunus yedoensis var. nudiflora TaxID=2094558 RepID=A0A314Z422_PRUYE|nr:E3 ubiquitin-protein ligase UPL1 [Prunus yedoensis var. nudiflora]
MTHLRGSNQLDGPGLGGILHHVIHRLLPLTIDKSAGPDEWRDKLSEKASWFLVVLCGRSSEGRRRVINELVKALSSFSNLDSSSTKSILLPDKRVYAFVDLVYSILSKNSSSSNLPGSGFSPDIAKSMIDGGMIQCLTGILRVIDLDHPDAPKTANLILKALESLTRAANASEKYFKSDETNKKKSTGLNGRSDDQLTAASGDNTVGHNQNISNEQDATDAVQTNKWVKELLKVKDMRIDGEGPLASNPPMELGMDFMREEMDGNVLGQPGAASGLIDVAAEPFEGVNVDDLFGLRRPLGFDRRRQTK